MEQKKAEENRISDLNSLDSCANLLSFLRNEIAPATIILSK